MLQSQKFEKQQCKTKSLVPITPGTITERIIGKIKRTFRDLNRTVIRNKIKKTIPCPVVDKSKLIQIHILVCKRDLINCLWAAKSLVLASHQLFHFVFHDDGTLINSDFKLLEKHFPGSTVVSLEDADKRVNRELKDYPMILEYRKKCILMYKLIDSALYSSSKKIIIMDTDILFFNKPDQLIECTKILDNLNYFNKDISTAYAMDENCINEIFNGKLPEQINSGLISLNVDSVKYSKIEKWLTFIHHKKIKYVNHRLEQTFFAMLTSSPPFSAHFFNNGYDVEFDKNVNNSICKHYVGLIRHGFELEGIKYLLDHKQFLISWNNLVSNLTELKT